VIVSNPPYGERIGNEGELKLVYRQLARRLKEKFGGWRTSLLVGNVKLEKQISLPVKQRDHLYNGGIESKLLRYEIRNLEETEAKSEKGVGEK